MLLDENECSYIESRVLDFVYFHSQDSQDELITNRVPYPLEFEKITQSLYSYLLEEGSFEEVWL